MRIEEFGKQVGDALAASAVAAPEGTYLYRAAGEFGEMVAAYVEDGRVFFRQGDLVNAHAAFTYGWGWFDAGRLVGLFSVSGNTQGLPFFAETMPVHLYEHLAEKTGRYARMLGEAMRAVELAPDRESPLHDAAEVLRQNASVSMEAGRRWADGGAYINALGRYSYGYGFLDAGIRAGLFRIIEKRHLFTV